MEKRKFRFTDFIAYSILIIFVITAIFSPMIANEKALLCSNDEGIHFPFLNNNWDKDCSTAIYPIIRYSHNNIDQDNANYVSPGGKQKLKTNQQRHILGTDQVGRDVAAGMIHGSSIALLTGALSMSIALIIGLLIGLFSAYYGNDSIRLSRNLALQLIIHLVLIIYVLNNLSLLISSGLAGLLFLLFYLLFISFISWLLNRFRWFKQKVHLPLDLFTSNFIEIFQSLPGSFLVLILVSLFTSASIFNVILIIGLLRWPMIARYVRAEMLKIREQRYIEASKAIGMSDLRILFRHAAPATLTPVIVAVAFGFSSAILLESALSFLGIGLPADHVSFGSMLSEARNNYEAWWLAVFPGMAIFCLVFAFNYLGDRISKQIEKK